MRCNIATGMVLRICRPIQYAARALTVGCQYAPKLEYIDNLIRETTYSRGQQHTLPQGVNNQYTLPQGVNNQCTLLQGVNNQCTLPQGVNNQGTLPQGVNNQCMLPQDVNNQGTLPQGVNNQYTRIRSRPPFNRVNNIIVNIDNLTQYIIIILTLKGTVNHTFRTITMQTFLYFTDRFNVKIVLYSCVTPLSEGKMVMNE
jgi:hypothetical protein